MVDESGQGDPWLSVTGPQRRAYQEQIPERGACMAQEEGAVA
jgi:hypothetical protein